MKFTKEQVKQIIKEEIEKYVFEIEDFLGDPNDPGFRGRLARFDRLERAAYARKAAARKKDKETLKKPVVKPTGVPTEKGYPLGFVSDPMYDNPEREEIAKEKANLEKRSIVNKPGWGKAETIDDIQAWADTLDSDEIEELETLFSDERDMEFLLKFGKVRPKNLARTELLDLLDRDEDLASAVQNIEAAAAIPKTSQKIKDAWNKLKQKL